MRTVLGIETSCDDTSIAIIRERENDYPEILSFSSFTQETILREWGGVIPEIAARNHLTKLVPLLKQCFDQANLEAKDIDIIGVTTHPGLLGPLLTGVNAAKSLAMVNHTPIVSVNHLYAHLEAIHMVEKIEYPYLGLLVSGGHGLYLLVRSETEFEVVGTTIDDAPGEAFDKGGKLLGMGYPAGRLIDDLAKEGDINKFEFPIGLRSSADANLSYSGVKTRLRVFLDEHPEYQGFNEENPGQLVKDICASYQHAIISALKLKMRYALKFAKEKAGVDHLPIIIGGGVACNSYLRKMMSEHFDDVHVVPPKFCTDNGAMIANYALRTADKAVPFPECLHLDARGRYISKTERKPV